MAKRYILEMAVNGSISVDVDAESLEEAKRKAEELYDACDLGELENPEMEVA